MTHKINRRSFLKSGAALSTSASLATLPVGHAIAQVPSSVLKQKAAEKVTWNACLVNCGSRCTLRAFTQNGAIAHIETDNTGQDIYGDHQARACLRGRSMRKRIYSAERLKYPMKRVGERGEGKFVRIGWDEALDTVAAALKKTIDTYGNEAVHILYGSGSYQLSSGMNAAPRLFNLLGGSLGSYGTYSSAQISFAAPYTYGSLPYSFATQAADAKLLVMFGHNPWVTRSSGAGQAYELQNSLESGRARMILIDPRYTDSALGKEDEWVPIRPGTDAALIEGMAHVMITENLVDQAFLDKYCIGYDEKTLPVSAPANSHYKAHILGHGTDRIAKTPAWASQITGIPETTIVRLAREIATTKPCFVTQGLGTQRQANGEQTARAIPMVPILTGNIGLPGTNTGLREGDSGLGEASLPTGANPVKTRISFFSWTDAIDRGPELTALRDGVQGKPKLDVPIKFLFVSHSNTLINQHSQTRKTHETLRDSSKCEMVVVIDNQMTPSARYADILLPDVSSFEIWDLAADGYASGAINFMVSLQPAHGPLYEARPFYDICSGLAQRLGVGDKFTEGRTLEQWTEYIYKQTQAKYQDQLPDYEAFKQQGMVRVKTGAEKGVALKAFRQDPVANKLNTPSGKIEIYSERLATIAATWELAEGDVITPLPQYVTTWESHLDPKTKQYPLQMIGFHTKGRTHSTYHNIDWLREVVPDEVWINPIDADERGIRPLDKVRVYNDRGVIEITAKVTSRIMPGVVAVPQGAWYKPDPNNVDTGPCINTLTSQRPSPLAKGNPQHTNLVEIVKAT